jgi:transposase-like protein
VTRLTLRQLGEERRPGVLQRILLAVRRVLSFTGERTNRLARFVVITRAYRKGEAVQSIADRYGCSRGTVLRYARLAGLPKRPRHSPADVRADVLRMYTDPARVPVADIARLHEVSPAYVSKVAREEGVSRYAPRPKHRRRRGEK